MFSDQGSSFARAGFVDKWALDRMTKDQDARALNREMAAE
jgi:hypothetical protein